MAIPSNVNTTNVRETSEAYVTEAEQHSVEHIDLALSGGGFRATLFHLGVIGFLRSHGLLSKVKTICSVSGGSILAAHMVTRWHEYANEDEQCFIRAAEHLIKAIQQDDVSRRALWRFRSAYRVLLRRALDTEALVDEYRRILGPTNGVEHASATPDSGAKNGNPCNQHPVTRWDDLRRLRNVPDLQILATHLNTATMCGFNRDSFFISSNRDDSDPTVTGLVQFARGVVIGSEEIARGVAASSAFPPIFAPLPVTNTEQSQLHLLTDGGVYDNSGVKRLREIYVQKNWTKDRNRLVIVSDAGRAFSAMLGNQFDTIVELATRVSDAQGSRIADFDSDQTQDFFSGHGIPVLRCAIHDTIDGDEVPTNHSSVVQRQLAAIRTELDKFSDVEVFALYRHGYLVARQQYLAKLGTDLSDDGGTKKDFWLPHKDSLINKRREEFEKALHDSHEMKKVASVRRIALAVLTIALSLILIAVGLVAFWAGRRDQPTGGTGIGYQAPLDTGTGYLIADVQRLEVVLNDSDYVSDGNRKWPFAYGSGLTYHQEVGGKDEFYLITDRGPAFDGPKTSDGKGLKLYVWPNYVPTIARVQWDRQPLSNPTVVQSLPLRYEGNSVEGLPPEAQSSKEISVAYALQNSFAEAPSRRFGIDPEDLAIGPDGAFWICDEYRPAVMKATRTATGGVEIRPNILEPGKGLPTEFAKARPNRGIESISIKGDWLFIALQGAFNADPTIDGHILIARAQLSQVEQFVKHGTEPEWKVFRYAIPDSYKKPVVRECSIGAIQAIDANHLLVLEREVKTDSPRAMINMVTLPDQGGEVKPKPVVDLTRLNWVSEKPEGITLVGDRTIVISSDNDFGMLLEGSIKVKVEDHSSSPISTTQLPITDMDLFETVADGGGKYHIKCKVKIFENFPLSLRPRDRADEKRPAFWVIRMKDPLI